MDKNKGNFFLGAMLGAAAGAIAGLLFAPKSGKETRKILEKKAKDYAEVGKDVIKKESVVLRETIDKIKDKK